MSTTQVPSRLLVPGVATHVTLALLANFTPFRGRNIAIVGCVDGRIGEAMRMIEQCSGANWHSNSLRPGGTLSITGELTELESWARLEPDERLYPDEELCTLVREIRYVQRQLVEGARDAGLPPEEAMLGGIVDLRHPYCAAAEFHIGDIPLEDQLARITAGQDRAAPLLLKAFPSVPVAQMIYGHQDNRWY